MSYQGTAIMGPAFAVLEQLEGYVRRVNPDAPEVARLYLELATPLGVRGDLAYAQAIHETDFFRYTGVVQPEQNNFSGIGATGPGNPGASFATPEEGVLAHLQHLYAYATTAPLPEGMELMDPRFDLVERGSTTHTGDLSGRWAADDRYGQKVDRHLAGILMEPSPLEPYQIIRADLDPTSQNRPGECVSHGCWEGTQGIVVHRTASPTMDARAIRNYFNDAPDGRFASSQFVVDNNEILLLMPIGEVAFHTPGKNLTHLGIETCEHNWGTPEWEETYRKLVWLCGYLVRAFRLDITDVTGHFWWDPVNRPYDPTHMGWSPEEGQPTGLFDWNQFVANVHGQAQPQPQRSRTVDVQVERRIQIPCEDGVLIDGTTYVPIRPYTECLAPGATVRWDPSGPRVIVELPSASSQSVAVARSPAGEAREPRKGETGAQRDANKNRWLRWWQRLWS